MLEHHSTKREVIDGYYVEFRILEDYICDPSEYDCFDADDLEKFETGEWNFVTLETKVSGGWTQNTHLTTDYLGGIHNTTEDYWETEWVAEMLKEQAAEAIWQWEYKHIRPLLPSVEGRVLKVWELDGTTAEVWHLDVVDGYGDPATMTCNNRPNMPNGVGFINDGHFDPIGVKRQREFYDCPRAVQEWVHFWIDAGPES